MESIRFTIASNNINTKMKDFHDKNFKFLNKTETPEDRKMPYAHNTQFPMNKQNLG